MASRRSRRSRDRELACSLVLLRGPQPKRWIPKATLSRSRRPQHRDRVRVVFNDGLGSDANSVEQRSKVARCIRLREVNAVVAHGSISNERGVNHTLKGQKFPTRQKGNVVASLSFFPAGCALGLLARSGWPWGRFTFLCLCHSLSGNH